MTTTVAERVRRTPNITRRVGGVLAGVRTDAGNLLDHVPGAVHATRSGAQSTTTALQVLPDSTLRTLAATFFGLGAGLCLARAPRLIIVIGMAPAAFFSAAIALRPIRQDVPPRAN